MSKVYQYDLKAQPIYLTGSVLPGPTPATRKGMGGARGGEVRRNLGETGWIDQKPWVPGGIKSFICTCARTLPSRPQLHAVACPPPSIVFALGSRIRSGCRAESFLPSLHERRPVAEISALAGFAEALRLTSRGLATCSGWILASVGRQRSEERRVGKECRN